METNLKNAVIAEALKTIISEMAELNVTEKINTLNEINQAMHAAGPFAGEPVGCVLWVASQKVEANDYNPNAVAPPEMRLLNESIESDGYTQPIVTWPVNGNFEVVDGFHRNRIGKENKIVSAKLQGYLPITIINPGRHGRADRIAATIRHNRARGKHQVSAMSDIVQELSRRNWSEKKIAVQLGMEPDEVLRLKQITGIADLFSEQKFSEAWEAQ